ncbi:MAG: hypothetical protein HZA66_05870 [Rhodopseudomonas palustris]|uniref:Uncharacterized protein n=1 Tax=Rhodopseudomonas palustris TaxID=1076 RepID=A0A933W160_RHOPL|nr:hypothetical protein [Rhodopseudomonas palustris]
MRTFSITSPATRGAVFTSRKAAIEFVPEALEVERIIRDYERTREPSILWDELTNLGYERSEIEAIAANPRKRLRTTYLVL